MQLATAHKKMSQASTSLKLPTDAAGYSRAGSVPLHPSKGVGG